VTTYEEWRVTGVPRFLRFEKTYPTEADAREFIGRATVIGAWTDGPHLHKRTVTVTDWEEA